MKTLIEIFLLTAVVACSTSTTVIIKSNPDKAKIYVSDFSSEDKKLLGETPFSGRSDEIKKVSNGSGPVFFTLEKEGYFSQRLFVTELNAAELSVNMNLIPERVVEQSAFLDEVISGLFESQRLVKSKRFEEALSLLGKLEEKMPFISSIYEIKGGIYFLQKNYGAALEAFNLALKYNPKNIESRRMKNALLELSGQSLEPAVKE
jgi:tetratricopeptide (TPR) repeat protein